MKKTLASALAALFLLAVPMLAAADGPHRYESANRHDTHWSEKNHRGHESRYDRGSYKHSGGKYKHGHNTHYAKPYSPGRYQKHRLYNRTSRHCNSRSVRVTGVPNFFIRLNW